MKKHTMLGVNGDDCCLLLCLLKYEDLDFEDLAASDFIHSCTNWSGCDKIKRTLELRKLSLTGNYTELEKPLVFTGSDIDWGKYYPWEFKVKEIFEVQEA